MKLVAILIFVCPLAAFAQFSKGTHFFAGSIMFLRQSSSQHQGDNNTNQATHFFIQPGFGFFLNEKLSLGGSVGYSYRKEGSPTYVASGVTLGLNIRRFFRIKDNFLISVDGSLGYQRGNSDNSTSAKVQYYSFGVGLSPTFHFFPSANWSVQMGIGSMGYNYSKNNTYGQTLDSFGINFGLLNFGWAYYFRKSD